MGNQSIFDKAEIVVPSALFAQPHWKTPSSEPKISEALETPIITTITKQEYTYKLPTTTRENPTSNPCVNQDSLQKNKSCGSASAVK